MGIRVESHASPDASARESAARRARPPADSWLRRPAAAVAALTLAGGALRFATLNVQSLWLDESATIVLVRRSFAGMLSHLASSESAPPLYYVLAWAWTHALGAGPLGFRSLSALAGTATIPVVYAAGRELSTRAGVWAAALAAVNPALYYYSQEARAYALVILLSAVALVCWQRALRAPTARNLWLWAGASGLAVLTHYFAAFLFLPEAALLAGRNGDASRRRVSPGFGRVGWGRALLPSGAVALVGLALVPLAARQRGDGKTSWIETASLASRLGESAKQFLVGLYGPLEILAALASALLAAGAVALLVRRGAPRERRGARDLAVLAAVALALPALLAITQLVDVYDGRNVIAAWTPCAVVVAAGLGAARAARAGAALGAGLCAVSLAIVAATVTLPAYQRDDWRGAARALAPPRGGRAVVGGENSALPLALYLPGATPAEHGAVAVREVAFVTLRTRRTGSSPLPPALRAHAPAGFRPVGARRAAAYAVARFAATRPTRVTIASLRRASGEAGAEVLVQP